MAVTEAEIVRDIRAHFALAAAPVDLGQANITAHFRSQNATPQGVRPRHAIEALARPTSVDTYDDGGKSIVSLAVAQVVGARPHTLLVYVTHVHHKPPMIDAAWRLYGVAPEDPTQAFANLVARYGQMLEAGSRAWALLRPARY